MDNANLTLNNTESSYQWNEAITIKLISIYVILSIYLILGIAGNSLVLFIYLVKFKTYSEGRYFVPVLAVTDMLSCIVSSCGHASETLLPIIYKIDIACKIERYVRMIATAFSMFTLVLIVVDRYLKVCRPYGRQMTKPWKKIFLGLVIISGLLVSAPSFLFYGSAPKVLDDGSITGRRCSSVNGGLPKLAVAFNVSLFSIASLELVLMSVLYFLIGRVIFKTAKFRNQAKTRNGRDIIAPSTTAITNIDVDQGMSTSDVSLDLSSSDTRKHDTTDNREQGKQDTADNWEQRKQNPTYNREQSHTDDKSTRKRSNRDSSNSRITKVFLAITVAFGISFIPTISMMILESIRADFWFTLTDQEYVGFMFLYTFYIFNNFINPFIYVLMDEKFKQEVINLHVC